MQWGCLSRRGPPSMNWLSVFSRGRTSVLIRLVIMVAWQFGRKTSDCCLPEADWQLPQRRLWHMCDRKRVWRTESTFGPSTYYFTACSPRTKYISILQHSFISCNSLEKTLCPLSTLNSGQHRHFGITCWTTRLACMHKPPPILRAPFTQQSISDPSR